MCQFILHVQINIISVQAGSTAVDFAVPVCDVTQFGVADSGVSLHILPSADQQLNIQQELQVSL